MIRITKPEQPPPILTKKGKAKRRGISAPFTRFAQDYASGNKRFKFDRDIYAHESVKEGLINAQLGKCAFCESQITHISYGDVEHFRPKAGYRQNSEDELATPGYYWLAYEWDNLFLACQLCNQRFKRNLFPLTNPATRATSHQADLHQEQPLFVDPAVDNPEEHISFRREIVYAINDNPRGAATIQGLGLDRPKLSEVRWDRYEALRLINVLANLDAPIPESVEARAYLNIAVEGASEFASMARAAIAMGFSL
jgi:uncharacterized protein (TIGR02646 family)